MAKSNLITQILLLSLMLMATVVTTSCSTTKKASPEASSQEGLNLDELNESEKSDMAVLDEGIKDSTLAGDSVVEEQAAASDTSLVGDTATTTASAASESTTPAAASSYNSGSDLRYTVEQGDTLMWIAFKLYGDYQKWRTLAKLNKHLLAADNSVAPGATLTYTQPEKEFAWKPDGDPYLIKLHDTLGKISRKVYETPKHWKKIWNNNRTMIKNPNLIFAGFTLYYLPINTNNTSSNFESSSNQETAPADTASSENL
ncbi:MAG: LysM peptidoglycan-binding domain-containing protein [Oligoflexia bacterium]|nr:LysM peptidoglycan-binding domain-containing protein [Oligoflexia bacterium]MBF0364681.1 LysM peptidoglycan-binding domain-containing protein [Oligoflexia bacterium]